MLVATAVTYPIYYILEPVNLATFRPSSLFSSSQPLYRFSKRSSVRPSCRFTKRWAFICPWITTNCAILGVMLINIQASYGFGDAMISSLGAGVGYTLAMFLFTGAQKMESRYPPLEGLPSTLMAASIVSAPLWIKGVIENLFARSSRLLATIRDCWLNLAIDRRKYVT